MPPRGPLPRWASDRSHLATGSCRTRRKVLETKLMRHSGAQAITRGLLVLGLFLQPLLTGLSAACLSGSLPVTVDSTPSECCLHHDVHDGSACPLRKTGQHQSQTHTCAFACHSPHVLSLLSFESLFLLPAGGRLPAPVLLVFSFLLVLFVSYPPGHRPPLLRPPMRLAH